jgi:hypothetical protein
MREEEWEMLRKGVWEKPNRSINNCRIHNKWLETRNQIKNESRKNQNKQR